MPPPAPARRREPAPGRRGTQRAHLYPRPAGAQGDRVRAEAQPDAPDRAELGGGLRVVHIPVGAAGKRGEAELLAHVLAFSDPLRARRRRERPDVVAGAVTKTARLLANKGPKSTYVRNS
jgi:hypothetical protein